MGESISDLHILSSRGVREKKELFANTSKKMKGMMVSYGSYMGKQAEAEVPKLQSRVPNCNLERDCKLENSYSA